MRRQSILVLAVVLLCWAEVDADMAIIFDNSPPNLLSGHEMTAYVQANDFQIDTAATITSINFWTLEERVKDNNQWDGFLQYFFFEDVLGPPPGQSEPVRGAPSGSPFAYDDAVNISKNATGRLTSAPNPDVRRREYLYTFDLATPLFLQADTIYWLGLHCAEEYDSRDEIYWETTSIGTGNHANFFYNNGPDLDFFDYYAMSVDPYTHHTFTLTGNPVPVPSAVILGSLGLTFSGWLLRRRRML